ncbi:MAG: hypothetical protein S4CHLAM20_05710 [Chlamydiia bacterium]|nr:hypothetical protein [Chlamydiia bacterium]
MKQLIYSIFLFITLFSNDYNHAPRINDQIIEKKFVVGIASYNNEKYFKKNLDSVFLQNYKNFRVIYSDDASTDNTWDFINKYIDERGLGDRITLRHNSKNKGAMYNHYQMVNSCTDDEIYVSLDGDDWFSCKNVLKRLNQAYLDEDVWMTYGNEILFPEGRLGADRKLRKNILADGKHRELPFIYAPPRSFYAGLFKKIPTHLFQDQEGQFFSTSCDVAYMLNMIDMARDHVYYIDDVLYVYNRETALNDFKKIPEKQLQIEKIIRQREPLKPVDHWSD